MTPGREDARDVQNAGPARSFGWQWFAPALLAGLFVAVLGGLLWLMHGRALSTERSQLQTSLNTAREAAGQRLQATRDFLAVLAEDIARGSADEDLFRQRLDRYMREHPELVRVTYVDASGMGLWSAPARVSADPEVGIPLACPQSQQGFEQAKRTGQAVFSPPHISIEGEPAFDVNVPAMRNGEFRGSLVGVFSCQRILRHTLSREVVSRHHVGLVSETGGVLVSLPAARRVDERLVASASLTPPGKGLRLQLGRYGGGFWGVGVTLLGALCVALVIGMAWGMWSLNRQIARRAKAEEGLRQARDELADRVRDRTADLEEANRKLQGEMRERQRAEEQARQRQEELAHVGRVSTMGEMAAGLAHELNQPLGAIASFADGASRFVESAGAKDENVRMALEEISEQARRAGGIIHRLRSFVAKGEPRKAPAALGPLVNEVIDIEAPDLRQEQVELGVDIPADLPEIRVDRIQIQQVVLNLMRNAMEAMLPAGGERELSISARSLEAAVEVAVADTGPPCTPETVKRMFDAFYTTKPGGIGMGLSISRSIIEAHGGRLWAECNDGRGMVMHFTLPTTEGEADDWPGHTTDPGRGIRCGR